MFFLSQFIFCVIFGTQFLSKHTSAYYFENMTQLKATLLTGYDSDVVPISNQTDSLNVTVGMTLYQILDVDTVRGVVTTTLTLECYWTDERIKWTPSDYGGINSVMIQSKYVWNPPLTLGQPVEFTALGENWMHVTYQSNGFAFWRPGGVNELTCFMNMKYWPFDEQTCDITYFAYDYWEGQISFSVTGLVTTYFTENGEWALEKTEASTATLYGIQQAAFKITLKRRPAFYILTLILPLAGLGLLTSFVFILPSESGERVSYAITVLLALTVFLTIVSDNIPKTSNPVPLLCIFLLTGVFMSSLATVIVIINLRIFHRSPDKKIGRLYVAIVRVVMCRSNNVNEETLVEPFKSTNTPEKDSANKGGKIFKITRKQSASINDSFVARTNETYQNVHENDNLDATWKDVSSAIDTIMFVGGTGFHVLTTIIWMTLFFTQ